MAQTVSLSGPVAQKQLHLRGLPHHAEGGARENGPKPVPLHLRNATTSLQREWGYGRGYLYPHNFPKAWADQDYLPNELLGRKFYHPKDQGEESKLVAWLRQFKKNL